jgi:hypothetical protein
MELETNNIDDAVLALLYLERFPIDAGSAGAL